MRVLREEALDIGGGEGTYVVSKMVKLISYYSNVQNLKLLSCLIFY